MENKKFHWRDVGYTLLAIQIGFFCFIGYWVYQKYHYLDVPVEAREYCEIVGFIAYGAGYARDQEGMSERQHVRRMKTRVANDLLWDWEIVIEGSFNDRSRNPEQLKNKALSNCLWRFRHGGKSIENDHGRVFW